MANITNQQLKKQAQEIYNKVKSLVRGWIVEIEIEQIEGYFGNVSYNDAERRAWIKINPDKVTPETLPQVLIHELSHIVLRDYDVMGQKMIKAISAPAQDLIMFTLLEDELERCCDTIAMSLAPIVS